MAGHDGARFRARIDRGVDRARRAADLACERAAARRRHRLGGLERSARDADAGDVARLRAADRAVRARRQFLLGRSEEHTSELQSLMRISYAVFCLKQKIHTIAAVLIIPVPARRTT